MKRHDIARYERVEMYLKAILTLQVQAPPVTVAKVAEYSGVSAPSAHEMLQRLHAGGLILAKSEGYQLTAEGHSRVSKILRRLRLAERFLVDLLHLDLAKAYPEACKFEHVINDEVEAGLAKLLGYPTRCPHGLPIPPTPSSPGDREETPQDMGLDALQVGQAGRVLSIPEEDTPLVSYLCELGLLPETVVEVRARSPFEGPLLLRVGTRDEALGLNVARRIRISPHPATA